ncbi:MAG TPA: amidohydrolase family protein, partial [Methylomirabilota bacterium]
PISLHLVTGRKVPKTKDTKAAQTMPSEQDAPRVLSKGFSRAYMTALHEIQCTFIDIILGGVLERFPKLKIVVAHGGGYVAHYPARMDHVWTARVDARAVLKKKPRQSLAKLYFDTIVFDREQLRHLVNLWGAGHIVAGTDYPYDMGWYDPRGFVDGCAFLKDGDKARILGLNAAKLLKLKRPRG